MSKERRKKSAMNAREAEDREKIQAAIRSMHRSLDNMSIMLRTGVFSRNWWIAFSIITIISILVGVHGLTALMLILMGK